MIRKILLAAMIGTSAATVALPGIAADRVVYVQVAPPVIRQEVVPAPRRGYAWAPGYWGWRHSKHVWVRGVWCAIALATTTARRPGANATDGG